MAWTSVFYGDHTQIRDAVLQWAEKNRFPVDQFEVEPRRINASKDEPVNGATITIRTFINRRTLDELERVLKQVPGCRPRVWRLDPPSANSL